MHTLQEVYIDKFDQLDESLITVRCLNTITFAAAVLKIHIVCVPGLCLLQSLQAVCDEWAPGIQIIAIRVTKPRIPYDPSYCVPMSYASIVL